MLCNAHNSYFCAKNECVEERDKKLNKIKKAVPEEVAIEDSPRLQASFLIDKPMEEGKPFSLDEMVAAMNEAAPHDTPLAQESAEPFSPSQLNPEHSDPPVHDVSSALAQEEDQSHSDDPGPTSHDTTHEEAPLPAAPFAVVGLKSSGSRTGRKIPPPRKR